MRSLIVCESVSHGNTSKIAYQMAAVLGSRVATPSEVDPAELDEYDLVGFGSGIFGMRFHPALRRLVDALEPVHGPRAFVFFTSGAREPKRIAYSRHLAESLQRKGFTVIGTWSCRGWDTWLPLRVFGGLNKGRPNSEDVESARQVAIELATQMRGMSILRPEREPETGAAADVINLRHRDVPTPTPTPPPVRG